ARIAGQRRLDARVRGAHADTLQAPLPAALLRQVLGAPATAAGVPAATTVTRLASRRRLWRVATHLGALAAGVALAVAALPWLRGGGDQAAWVQGHAGLRANAALAAALDRQLSGSGGGEVQVTLSFRGRGGGYCRAFRLAEAGVAGLACRSADGWTLPVLAAAPAVGAGDLRQAASPLPAAVLDAVDARMAGDALDAAGERAARAAGWR
ncbi:MAG: hypothetical protein QM601_11255, partial [Pseudoxanthomonas sp.]